MEHTLTTWLRASVQNAFVHDIRLWLASPQHLPAFQWTFTPWTWLHKPFSQPHNATWQQTPEQNAKKRKSIDLMHMYGFDIRQTFRWDYAMPWIAMNDSRNWCHSPTNLRQFQLKFQEGKHLENGIQAEKLWISTCISKEFGHQQFTPIGLLAIPKDPQFFGRFQRQRWIGDGVRHPMVEHMTLIWIVLFGWNASPHT